MTVPDPYETARSLLTAVVTVWAGAKLPDIRYVAEGRSAPPDGAQLTVAFGPLSQGLPGAAGATSLPPRAFPISASFDVTLIRTRGAGLTTQGGRQVALPKQSQDAAAGKAFGADMKAMLTALLTIRENKSVVTHPTKIGIGPVVPLEPSGDLVGLQGTVTILLGHDNA